MSKPNKPQEKRPIIPEESFFAEVFGIGLAGLVLCFTFGILAVLFWLVYCWPFITQPHLIPLVMPLRITIVTFLSFFIYSRLSRPRRFRTGFEREYELIALLAFVTLLACLAYFLGVSDGATNVVEFDAAVRLRRALTIFVPCFLFAILGYMKSRDLFADSKSNVQTGTSHVQS